MLFFDRDFFLQTTPLHLLLMAGLLFYTSHNVNTALMVFFAVCFITGITVEIIGTSTGMLFGNYAYGQVLGPGIKNVPLIIGVNWFIIMYCCAAAIESLFIYLASKYPPATVKQSNLIKHISIIVDGATLAVLFDIVLEPAAIKLGYWQWAGDGTVPLYNYFCWFLVSICLLAICRLLKLQIKNKFAVNLLLIQIMFFLLVTTFL